MNDIRSALYLTARLMGDANALLLGPMAVLMRMARKVIWRTFASIMRGL